MTAIYNSVTLMYDGICATCGQPTGSADLWQDTCPRCAELAALEREIGRLQIGAEIVSQLDDRYLDVIVDIGSPYSRYLWTHLWCVIEREQDRLYARWRQLHAAGAESEQM